MIQKIIKNNDKKLNIFMSMMQKILLDLELKWIRNAFYKMDDQMKIKVELVKRKSKAGKTLSRI